MFTTKVLLRIFSVGLVVFSVIAYIFNPEGMIGNIISELIGLCLAAIVIELLLVAREEQSKSDYEQQQNSAVTLSLSQNTAKGRSLIIFLNSFIITKIKDPSLWLRFKAKNGESMSSIKLTQGEFNSLELALQPLVTEKELDDAISKATQEPDELVVRWIDQHNVSRERAWPISRLRYVQESLKGKHDIFSGSL